MKDRANTSTHTIRNNIFMLNLVFKISPARIILTFILRMYSFGVWVFQTVIFMRYFFGNEEMNRTFPQVSAFLVFSMLIYASHRLLESWFYHRFARINNQLLYKELNHIIFHKACNVDISCFENTEFYNNYTKATNEVFNRAVAVVDCTATIVASLISVTYVIYTMININLLIGLMSILPVVGNLVFGKLAGKIDYEKHMDLIKYQRRQNYVDRTVYLRAFAKEIRITNIFSVLKDTYNEASEGIITVSNKYWKRLYVIANLKNILCFPLVFEGTWLLGAYLAMVKKAITVADFVVIASAAVSTTWMLISFSDNIVRFINNALYVDNLITFLNYEEKIPEDHNGQPVPDKIETLEFRNVSFKYEGASQYTLKCINLKLDKDRLVSLVGHNGSGKTTLVKLIMRLYDPTEGEVLLNGINIKEYNLKEYRSLVGTTFQDFQIFSMSVLDNVIMGNEISGDIREKCLESLKKGNVYETIMSLPNAEETTLTREFDENGYNLSGGENQKVAIARAFAKESLILLLDEPSSALDPIAEYELFNNLIELCKGEKIGVFISHRLSSATLADMIYLLENGEISEQGNHSTLMRKNGSYANMFRKQAENYLLEVTV